MSTGLVDTLRSMHDQHGELTPELVVQEAAAPEHPLHDRFDWDDTVAAQKWRLTQAAQLLRVTFRPDPEKPTDLRAFVRVKGQDSHRSNYVPIEKALEDDLTRRIVLQAMEREWKALFRRYKDHVEFAQLIARDMPKAAS